MRSDSLTQTSNSAAYSWWVSAITDPRWLQALRLVVLATGFIFVGMQLSGGVVRWILDMVGAAVLTYIPNALMLLCLFVVLISEVLNARLRAVALLFLIWIALMIVIGSYNTGVKQSVFGLWVLLPFLFGLALGPVLMQTAAWRPWFYAVMFMVAAGGVIAHQYVSLPWVGVSYQVGGVELEGAREWHASGGKQRLSGFARSSFDVAGQIMVAAGLWSLYLRSFWMRLILWVICMLAISLSTSKGILLALLMAAIASEALLRQQKWVLSGVFVVGVIWLFLPPLLGWSLDWTEAARVDIDHPIYGSFIDRMNDMWPRALELITNTSTGLLGRGLGGIGVPVSVFEPALANAGDNLWVYAFVVTGIVCIPFFVWGFVQLFKLCGQSLDRSWQEVLLLAVMVNWYGGVSNILEHAVLALAFGIVCRYVCVSTSSTIAKTRYNLL
jgi:hypothetical protein